MQLHVVHPGEGWCTTEGARAASGGVDSAHPVVLATEADALVSA